MSYGPTYCYKDKVTGELYEVRQKITAKSFKTVGEICDNLDQSCIPELRDHPVTRQINCEGGAIISGQGVYKSGLIVTAVKESKKKKAGVHTFTMDDIMNQEDEDEDN